MRAPSAPSVSVPFGARPVLSGASAGPVRAARLTISARPRPLCVRARRVRSPVLARPCGRVAAPRDPNTRAPNTRSPEHAFDEHLYAEHPFEPEPPPKGGGTPPLPPPPPLPAPKPPSTPLPPPLSRAFALDEETWLLGLCDGGVTGGRSSQYVGCGGCVCGNPCGGSCLSAWRFSPSVESSLRQPPAGSDMYLDPARAAFFEYVTIEGQRLAYRRALQIGDIG